MDRRRPALTDDWYLLEQLAGSADWPAAAAQPRAWASGPGELAGDGDGLAETLAKVPTRRLVVLGEPGAGKTMLMVRLVLSLVHHRHPGDPVPLLVPLASWDPAEQGLREWLRAQMSIEHPELAAAAAGTGARDRAETLLEAGLILPILDGLDEIPAAVRGPAIAQINDALGPGDGVVITCRTQEYRRAVRPPEGPEITLRAAAAIELDPLATVIVAEYLLADAGGPVARKAWEPVIAALGTGAPVARALTTPLMISLARIVYNIRPGETGPDDRAHNPAELCSEELFPAREDIEHHLLDNFIWAAYRPGPGPARGPGRRSWDYAQARRWLVFLARDQQDNGTPGIAWWKLPDAVPRYLIAVVLGLFTGIVAAVGYPFVGYGIGLTLGLLTGIAVRGFTRPSELNIPHGIAGGLIGGMAAGIIELAVLDPRLQAYGIGEYLGGGTGIAIGVTPLASFRPSLAAGFVSQLVVGFYENGAAFGSLRLWLGSGTSHVFNGTGVVLAAVLCVRYSTRREVPAHGMRWSPIWLVCGVTAGLIIGFIAWIQIGKIPGLIIGIVATAIGGINGRIAGVAASDPAKASSPRDVLRRDRVTFLGSWLEFGIGVGFVTGLTGALSPGPAGQPHGTRYGIELAVTNVIVPALGFGFIQALWGRYLVSRCWLAVTGQLPWRLMAFLHDAHTSRGVLRQVGAVYQFRHLDLQRRIASWPIAAPETPPTTTPADQLAARPDS
jgi:hypothetical protein